MIVELLTLITSLLLTSPLSPSSLTPFNKLDFYNGGRGLVGLGGDSSTFNA